MKLLILKTIQDAYILLVKIFGYFCSKLSLKTAIIFPLNDIYIPTIFDFSPQNHTDNNHKFPVQLMFKTTQILVSIAIVVIGWAKHGTCDHPLPTQGQTEIPRHDGHTTNRICSRSDRQVHCWKDGFAGTIVIFSPENMPSFSCRFGCSVPRTTQEPSPW